MNRTATLLLCGFFVLLLGLPARAQSSSDDAKPLKMVTLSYGEPFSTSIDRAHLLGVGFQYYFPRFIGLEVGYEYTVGSSISAAIVNNWITDYDFRDALHSHRLQTKLHFFPIRNKSWMLSVYGVGGVLRARAKQLILERATINNITFDSGIYFNNRFEHDFFYGFGARLQRNITKGLWIGLDMGATFVPYREDRFIAQSPRYVNGPLLVKFIPKYPNLNYIPLSVQLSKTF